MLSVLRTLRTTHRQQQQRPPPHQAGTSTSVYRSPYALSPDTHIFDMQLIDTLVNALEWPSEGEVKVTLALGVDPCIPEEFAAASKRSRGDKPVTDPVLSDAKGAYPLSARVL
eukprot:Mycagemm_TRINITY_DN1368_c0_g1::TRINITY_DN1368_c0_g1_i1::g.4417::m.4417 type:complete len:113 gc:universal TRINITY_DN1368_c0_g1_i1:774-436(-)